MADRRLAVEIHQEHPIPLDVAFTCDPGDVLAIFGPSGSGKTTILRAIAGLSRPEHASIRSGGQAWTDTARGIQVPPHRRPMGFLFQDYALFPHLTAIGNVTVALGHHPRGERAARASDLLSRVNLLEHQTRWPHELSGGERQRVALARALAREPAALLLDEPFSAVDRAVRRRLQDEIDTLRRSLDMPLVLVTHDFDDVVRLATHVLLLERGRSIACGPLTELMSRPDLSWLRAAVGLGSIFEARVARTYDDRELAELDVDGTTFVVSNRGLESGSRVRLRIPAREVILATLPPHGLSLHNMLTGTVRTVHSDPAFDHPIVQIDVGRVPLLAEVTSDAVVRLGIRPGLSIHALIKSVAVEVIASEGRQTAREKG